MIFLLIICAGLTLFSAGVAVGFILGQERGAEDAYGAVNAYHEGRTR